MTTQENNVDKEKVGHCIEHGPRSPMQILSEGLERRARGQLMTGPEFLEMALLLRDSFNRVFID